MSKEQIEEMAKDIFESKVAIDGIDIAFAAVHGANMKDSHFMRMATHLFNAGYRKQNENTVELPCEIGETMYVVSRYYTGNWEIFKCKVESITMYGTNTFISLISVKGNFVFGENVSSINKNVFFAEEEAKKAFAKMKGGAE